MEILKRGKVSEDRTREWTCLGCRSEIRAKITEGRRVSDPLGGDSIVLTCPVCERENWIDASLFQ